jgi:hypothetical protein
MTLLMDLKHGRGGVRLAIPTRLTIDDDRPEVTAMHDAENGVGWHLSRHDHHLDLRAEHQDLLVRDIERHTRTLFDIYSQSLSSAPFGSQSLRTQDPTWSPVVSIERVQIGTADALIVIHRMSYQPGNELLMGHLLVPIRRGLFELRVLAKASMTGTRESILLSIALKNAEGESPEDVMKRLGQKHYDDPQYDILFPDHPLSRVRAELRVLLEDGVIEVTEPDELPPHGEELLPELGCAITPPPRYARTKTDSDFVQWSRVAFAGTDGVQLLTVLRENEVKLPKRGAEQRLLRLAKEYADESLPNGATNVEVNMRRLPERDGRVQVRAYVAYDPADGSALRHTAIRWFADALGRPVAIAIATEQCVPKNELLAEIEAIASSWRWLDGEKKAAEASPAKKPWWKVW